MLQQRPFPPHHEIEPDEPLPDYDPQIAFREDGESEINSPINNARPPEPQHVTAGTIKMDALVIQHSLEMLFKEVVQEVYEELIEQPVIVDKVAVVKDVLARFTHKVVDTATREPTSQQMTYIDELGARFEDAPSFRDFCVKMNCARFGTVNPSKEDIAEYKLTCPFRDNDFQGHAGGQTILGPDAALAHFR